MSLLTCNKLCILHTANSETCLQLIPAEEMVGSKVTKGVVLIQPGPSV